MVRSPDSTEVRRDGISLDMKGFTITAKAPAMESAMAVAALDRRVERLSVITGSNRL
jgi:hypothetical protein